jgi:4-amino-4-deoxy-L-arabinose transferase-like glycosyltransferase
MLASGDWLVPTLNQQVYISKPPLLYWLAGITALLFDSASEWVVRLPSALAITWLSFFAMRRHFGLTPAVFTVLILITSAGFASFSRRAEIEMLLAALCSGSVLAASNYIFGRQDKRWLLLCRGIWSFRSNWEGYLEPGRGNRYRWQGRPSHSRPAVSVSLYG